jgi:peptide/nickel transport system ATP-binding protein
MVPTLIGELPGCSFRSRCQYAEPRCAGDVALQRQSGERGWRCVLSEAQLQGYARQAVNT